MQQAPRRLPPLPAVLLPLQPAGAVRHYRTVNHDAQEALEHANEPWTPRPDPHRLMQPPPQPPAADVLHALGSRHGVADAPQYIRVVQVRQDWGWLGARRWRWVGAALF